MGWQRNIASKQHSINLQRGSGDSPSEVQQQSRLVNMSPEDGSILALGRPTAAKFVHLEGQSLTLVRVFIKKLGVLTIPVVMLKWPIFHFRQDPALTLLTQHFLQAGYPSYFQINSIEELRLYIITNYIVDYNLCFTKEDIML